MRLDDVLIVLCDLEVTCIHARVVRVSEQFYLFGVRVYECCRCAWIGGQLMIESNAC